MRTINGFGFSTAVRVDVFAVAEVPVASTTVMLKCSCKISLAKVWKGKIIWWSLTKNQQTERMFSMSISVPFANRQSCFIRPKIKLVQNCCEELEITNRPDSTLDPNYHIQLRCSQGLEPFLRWTGAYTTSRRRPSLCWRLSRTLPKMLHINKRITKFMTFLFRRFGSSQRRRMDSAKPGVLYKLLQCSLVPAATLLKIHRHSLDIWLDSELTNVA